MPTIQFSYVERLALTLSYQLGVDIIKDPSYDSYRGPLILHSLSHSQECGDLITIRYQGGLVIQISLWDYNSINNLWNSPREQSWKVFKVSIRYYHRDIDPQMPAGSRRKFERTLTYEELEEAMITMRDLFPIRWEDISGVVAIYINSSYTEGFVLADPIYGSINSCDWVDEIVYHPFIKGDKDRAINDAETKLDTLLPDWVVKMRQS